MFTPPLSVFYCEFSPIFHNLATFLFFWNCNFWWFIDNRTSCRPIQSVIILVINKSDSRCAVVRFCYHSYDYRPNWTPLSPITITYYNFNPCRIFLENDLIYYKFQPRIETRKIKGGAKFSEIKFQKTSVVMVVIDWNLARYPGTTYWVRKCKKMDIENLIIGTWTKGFSYFQWPRPL